jgi:hypothetical protein
VPENIQSAVDQLLADWPPLTDEQINRIVALLRAGGGDPR